ncbi:MAG: hypothetical protein GY906_35580 [bacterium]|nr:hypothetical protein [bacterium]
MKRLTMRELKTNLRTQELAVGVLVGLLVLAVAFPASAEDEGQQILAQGAEVYGPYTPYLTPALRDMPQAMEWRPGDPIKEIPRRFYPVPGRDDFVPGEGQRDPLLDLQNNALRSHAPVVTVDLNMDGLPFGGGTPPDTVGDVGPDHYVQSVNASRIAVYDKTGTMLPGFPIALDSLAPGGSCASGAGDPIVLYDWLADRWFLQEFTFSNDMCIYVSQTSDPTGAYYLYQFTAPSFPDYPHFGVWPDAYYGTSNEDGSGGPQTTYAFERTNMLAGTAAAMQRLAVVPPVSGYGFQALTPADHDGDAVPPAGAPGIFMRQYDDEAHDVSPVPADDYLEMYEMTVDWATPANTIVTALAPITITDFNSWMINYSTFYSVPQPGTGQRLDPIREVVLQRLAYRNFDSHEALVGNFATNRDPATSGSNVEAGNRWFELRRTGGPAGSWILHQEGTFGGDTNSSTANFFMGSVAMDGQGNIALGYSKTDVGGSPIYPSIGFTGRLTTDALGTMGPENLTVAGVQAQTSSGRWGDYAAMSIDPADDCTFWFTNEYMPGSSWGTRITSFSFAGCSTGIFEDGFESGDISNWSSSKP